MRILIPLQTLDATHPALVTAQRTFPTAELHLLHIVPPAQATQVPDAQAQLKALGSGEAVAAARPSAEILSRVADYDLLMLGGHPHQTGLGAGANQVLRASTVPVLSVPSAEHSPPGEPFRHALLMEDFSPSTGRARAFMAQFCPTTSLHAVHAVNPQAPTAPFPIEHVGHGTPAEQVAERNRRWAAEARRQLDTLGSGEVVTGDAVDAALERLNSGTFDLLVVGTSNMGALERLIYGSPSRQLRRDSPVPVLTVH